MGVKVREKVKNSGEFYVFINHQGVRSAKLVGDKKVAEDVAKKISAAITLDQFHLASKDESSIPTVATYGSLWLESQIKGVLSESTHERYGYVLERDIIPFFGKLTLDKIEAIDVRDFINMLIKAGRTSRSISLSRTVLSSCLNEAVIENLIKKNPVKLFFQSRKRSTTNEARRPKIHKVNPFRNFEVKQFVDFVMQDSPDIYGPMFLCDFRTGFRLGELIPLHWSDIDWENGRIHLQRSYRKGKLEVIKDGEDRCVDMSTQLHEVLAQLLKTREAEAENNGTEKCEIIFHYKGGYRAQNTVRKAFKEYLEKAGLRTIRVHDMRHTYASQLLSNGANLAYVKEQLGHSSIKTTVDLYGHLVPGSFRDALNSLDSPITTPA